MDQLRFPSHATLSTAQFGRSLFFSQTPTSSWKLEARIKERCRVCATMCHIRFRLPLMDSIWFHTCFCLKLSCWPPVSFRVTVALSPFLQRPSCHNALWLYAPIQGFWHSFNWGSTQVWRCLQEGVMVCHFADHIALATSVWFTLIHGIFSNERTSTI